MRISLIASLCLLIEGSDISRHSKSGELRCHSNLIPPQVAFCYFSFSLHTTFFLSYSKNAWVWLFFASANFPASDHSGLQSSCSASPMDADNGGPQWACGCRVCGCVCVCAFLIFLPITANTSQQCGHLLDSIGVLQNFDSLIHFFISLKNGNHVQRLVSIF